MLFKPLSEIPEKFHPLINILKDGNKRFVGNMRMNQDFQAQRKHLIKGQAPEFTILTCSDSRVVPCYIFDAGLGELFIVRNAGNIVCQASLESIEYSSVNLKAPLFLILGHTHCGGCHEALEGAAGSKYINSLIESILPAINIAKEKNPGKTVNLDLLVVENVLYQMLRALDMSSSLKELVNDGNLAIVGAIYDIDTGDVAFLEEALY